jgi:hypothetical protein
MKTTRKSRRPFELSEGGTYYETVRCSSVEEALQIARKNVDRKNYPDLDEIDAEQGSKTLYIDIRVRCTETEEEGSETVTLEPEAPECKDGKDHDWQSPCEVVGGIADNPGVSRSGGGVLIREVCAHCAHYRITDTWATRADTGEGRLRSVSYKAPDERSRNWAEAK